MASTSQLSSYSVIDTEMYRVLVEGGSSLFEEVIARNQVNVLELQQSSDNKNTILHIAATSGQAELVYHILRKWPELMLKGNSEGDLPIHAALKSGKLKHVDLLIRQIHLRKEMSNQVFGWKNNNKEGSTPLHIALEYDLVTTAKKLVELYPPSSYVMNKEGICPLYMAIQKQNLELVRWMLSKLETSVPKRDALASLSKGKSVLHAAVIVNCHQTENSPTEILKEMLSYDDEVLIKIKDPQGWTALSCAAFSGSFEKVKVFTEAVPNNVFLSNKDESFPIHAAVHGGNSDIIDLLKNTWSLLDAKYHNILHVAVLTESSQIVSHLLAKPEVEEQSLINQKDKDGNTPLHLATLAKCVEVVRILIQDERVNVTLSNMKGLTAIDLAKNLMVTNPDDKQVRILNLIFLRSIAGLKNHTIDSALPVHKLEQAIRDMIEQSRAQFWDLINLEDGNNVLHYAATIADPAPFIRLFAGGEHWEALMKQANLNGDLPIHLAVKFGKLQNVNTLIDQQHCNSATFINEKDKDGNTPLHIATLAKSVKVVHILIQDGLANIDLLNVEGLTVVDLAKNLMVTEPDNKQVQILNLMFKRAIAGFKNHIIDTALSVKVEQAVRDMILQQRRVQFWDLINIEDGNNVLHYAATVADPVSFITLLFNVGREHWATLMEQANQDGDLPIHLAAKSGKLQYLQTVLNIHQEQQQANLAANSIHICERQNLDGNTALHEAVLNVHVETARYLFGRHKTAAYCLNKDNMCPLFLLIKNLYSLSRSPRNLNDLVQEMIRGLENNENIQNQLKNAKSIFHMAILARRKEILKLLIETAPCLVNSFDSSGRSPLSYAAYIGYVDGVSILLEHDSDLEFKRDKDKDGSFPIHYAAKGGQLKVVILFTLSEILMNNNKQNVLHVAAEKGRLKVVDYLLRHPSFKELVNTGDGNGNTALHLAAMGFHELVLCRLVVKEKHINVKATNKELAAKHPTYHSVDDQSIERLCWPLLYRNFLRKRVDEKKEEKPNEDKNSSSAKPSTWQKANMLLVVATLMIGISYNAIINPPGGYNKETGRPLFSSLPSNAGFPFKAFSMSIYYAFVFAMLAAHLLLVAAMVEKFSKFFFVMGTYCIYCGLFWMIVSCMGRIYADLDAQSLYSTILLLAIFIVFLPFIFFITTNPKSMVMLSSFRIIQDFIEHPDDIDI